MSSGSSRAIGALARSFDTLKQLPEPVAGDGTVCPLRKDVDMSDTPPPSGEGSNDPASTEIDGATDQDPSSSAGTDGASPAAADGQAPPGRRKAVEKRGFFRRHLVLVSLAVILALLAGSAGGYLWWLNHQIDNIVRRPMGVTPNPDKNYKESEEALNILLLGADHGNVGESVADDLDDGEWTPWSHLSDTIIIAHIPADRDSVSLVSIPRDSWVPIDGYPFSAGHGKINAAFSYGGPALSLKTVEDLSGISIDHVAIIDWVGFRDLTSALGGIRVYIPETFYDESQKISWEKGWHTYEGEEALAYVRTRYGLEGGDFDRIKRQQNFLRATMGKLLSGSTTTNPIRLTKVVGVVTKYLTVDDTWDNDEIRSLALSMRNIRADDVDFITAPFGKYDTTADGQSIVRLAPKQTNDLFTAIKDDDIDSYLEEYPDEKLGGPTSVN